MSFSHRIRTRLIRRVALGLAVAAVAAPVAQAAYEPLYQLHNAGFELARPDDRAVRPSTGIAGAIARPDDRAVRATFANPSTIELPAIEVGPDGFLVPKSGTGALPAHSVDGPRSGPANVTETPFVGGRFGRPHVAPQTGTSSTELAWPETAAGIGIGIGVAVAFGLAALGAAGMRRRSTLQGA
jgi:hypothetical protein